MSRRFGSVEQRPNGDWRARVWRGGKLVQLGKAVPTREEAEALVAGYAVDVGTVQSSLTVGGWGPQALKLRQQAGIRGIDQEVTRWDNSVASDPISDIALRALRRKDVVAWLDRTLKRKAEGARSTRKEEHRVDPSTVARTLAVLRAVLELALDRFGLEGNPAREVRVPRHLDATDEEDFSIVLLPDEQQRLLAVVPAHWLPYVRFAMYVGCRQGEQWELKWSDVDLQRKRLTLRRSRGGKPTKGGKPRAVIIPPPVLADLHQLHLAWKARHAAYEAEAAAPPKAPTRGHRRKLRAPGDWVFPGPRGGKHLPRAPEGWHNWVRAAGITRPGHDEPTAEELKKRKRHPPASAINWHGLRHTCATSLLAGWWGRKWSIEEVKTYIAHSSIQVTENYARYVESLASDAVAGTGWEVTTPGVSEDE